MIPVFENPAEAEKAVKETFSFPPFIMMENASRNLSEKILEVWDQEDADFSSVIFLCGKGNNGADGLACARMLYGKIPVYIYCPELPKTEEGIVQAEMCQKLKIPFLSETQIKKALTDKTCKIICDCIFGTGFHGTIPETWNRILNLSNESNAYRIACDISSGLSFNADLTVTMGTYKIALFSDKAKSVSGNIFVADLGITRELFYKVGVKSGQDQKGNCFLIEEKDISLPFRKEKTGHKGSYGHAVVITGEKSGAAILSAEAAMNFGAGLTTLLQQDFSNLKQFKISPELMISATIPKNCKALQIGSGLGDTSKTSVQNTINTFRTWFLGTKMPACVIDADMFKFEELPCLLKELNKVPEARIVLTPHPKELSLLVNSCLHYNITTEEALERRIEIGREFTKKYRNITLVMKGANTFIAHKGETYIFQGGAQSLAKGGSGDVLAGMITSLLAQGYSGKDAALTAVYRHGTAASEYGREAYNLTAKKLISLL